MRKLLMVLLIGFMLVPLTAVGEDNAQIVTFSTTTERVKLRERPDDNARVMGQYYGGQPLELLEQGKKWDYVSIGGRTGYMMRKYLTDLTEEAAAPVAEVYPEGESLSLYDQAGGNGRVIGTVEGEFELLGIVSQDWLHVRQVQADGAIVVGFVSCAGDDMGRGWRRDAGSDAGQYEAGAVRGAIEAIGESGGIFQWRGISDADRDGVRERLGACKP